MSGVRFIGNEKEVAKILNRQAREEMKYKLLNDILFDMNVCKLEGYNPKEYLLELKELIDDLLFKFIPGGKEMENENKVTLSLEEFLKLYDNKKELGKRVEDIIEYLLIQGFELNTKKELVFDKYNLSNTKMKRLLEKYDKARVEEIERSLKEEGEE